MQFDLGTTYIKRMLCQASQTYLGKITEVGETYSVSIQVSVDGKDKSLPTTAKQLLPLSVSYEVDDMVIVEVRSICETYILGLAKELQGTDISSSFYIRLGKNVLQGSKDGTSIKFASGDGNFTITHDVTGTKVEATGLVTVSGDMISVGKATAPALNACTACPLQGMHVPTVTDLLIG